MSAVDPYAPPRAMLAPLGSEPQVPWLIRAMILAGAGVAVVTALLATVGGVGLLGRDVPQVYAVYDFTAAFVIAGLGYGIWRRSRTCAVLALLTFAVPRLLILGRFEVSMRWIEVALAACYALGVIGTFRWHRFVADHRRAVIESARRRSHEQIDEGAEFARIGIGHDRGA